MFNGEDLSSDDILVKDLDPTLNQEDPLDPDNPMILHLQINEEISAEDSALSLTDEQFASDDSENNGIYSVPVDGTYVYNQDTGEIHFVDLNGTSTAIDSNDVEFVTVDGSIFGDFQYFDTDTSLENSTGSIFEDGSDDTTSNGSSTSATTEPVPSSSKPLPMTLRSKNAPALLRNSRRGATEQGSTSSLAPLTPIKVDQTFSCENSISKERSADSIYGKSEALNEPEIRGPLSDLPLDTQDQPIFILGDDSSNATHITHILGLDSSQDLTTENSGSNGILIFQNVCADSASEIFADNNVIFQLDNDGDGIFFNNGSSLGLEDPNAPKQPILPKRKTRRRKRKNQQDDSKGGNRGGGASELKCLEPGCDGVAYNLTELRKHLTNFHDMSFDLERKEFSSVAAFKEWRMHYERDRMVSFIYRGGTKKISKYQTVSYMICHRTGVYKPSMPNEASRKRKMKPQGSCKIGGYCTAGIKLVKDMGSGAIHADICHTHYGHPLDSEAIPHLRVNPVLKKMILKKFEEGLNFADMLAYIHHNPDGLEGIRVLDRRAIRNIYDTWKKSKNYSTTIVTKNNSAQSKKQTSKKSRKKCVKSTFSSSAQDSTKQLKYQRASKIEAGTQQQYVPKSCAVNGMFGDNSRSLVMECPLLPIDSLKPVKYEVAKAKAKTDKVKRKKKSKNSPGPIHQQNAKVVKQCAAMNSKPRWQIQHVVATTPPSTSACPEKRLRLENGEGKQESRNIVISSQLEATVDKLHNHGEAGPSILLYKRIGEINAKYGGFCRAFRENDFCLIIQTPVQRQIFQLFPKIVNIEIIESPNASENALKLVYAGVIDDFREAIPIAWMICDSTAPRYFNQFFRMLRYHCGELCVQYIMAPRDLEFLRAWTCHFSHRPKLIQNEILVKRDLRTLLNRHFPNDSIRSSAWSVIEDMMDEKVIENVKEHRADLERLAYKRSPEEGSLYFRKMVKDWLCRIDEWSLAYRVGAPTSLQFVADDFLKLRKFVSFKGTKRLNQNINHILKIGYDKCFLRTKRMFKGDQKLKHTLAELTETHKLAETDLKTAIVNTIEESHSWIVQSEGESVEVFHIQSPCDCKIRCKICNVCLHEYMCSCEYFQTEQTLCPHIHKVHCFRNNILFLVDDELEALPNENTTTESFALEGDVPVQIDTESGTIMGESSVSIINENDMEALNITEVLGLLGQQDGQETHKIVAITDIQTHKIIYGGSNASPLTIFQLDS